MKLKYILPALVFATLLAGCEKKPVDLDVKSPCCQEPTYVGDDDLIGTIEIIAQQSDANFELNLLFIPTIFTPNGDLINDSYRLQLFPGTNEQYKAELTMVKIYNDRKKLMAELTGSSAWDGKQKNGDVENGTYGYEATLTFPDNRELLVYGSFRLRTCIESGDNESEFIFADQLVPGDNANLPTKDRVSACN